MSESSASPVFTCQMCGHCCEGSGGIVMSPADLARLAAWLGQSVDEVQQHYLEHVSGKWRLKSADGKCVFFSKGRGCTVHEGKPAVCRAWPFFRGNMVDGASLALAKDYCPGIDRNASHAEFVRQGRQYLESEGLLASDAGVEANALILPPSCN